MTLLGRQQQQQGDDELLAQLRELLFLPASPTTTTPPVVVDKVGHQSGGTTGSPPASSCDGRRRRRVSKRGRDDDNKNNGEQHEEPPHRHSCKTSCSRNKNKKKKEQHQKMSTSSLVTSVPDFDGYQWKKYGQKQIEGAMYARSYYRCTRSAEQGCPAKRTVQRNDDDGADGRGTPRKYTVVYMGEHTCTANDSMEAPVILETAAAVLPPATSTANNKRPQNHDDTIINSIAAPATSAGSCCSSTSTSTATGIESPAISDIPYWSSRASGDHVVHDYYCGLFGVHDSWAPAPAAALSLQEMEDFTGPIRSPVHIAAADGWTIDHGLLQLASIDQPLFHISLFS